jgi:hypothetical protein
MALNLADLDHLTRRYMLDELEADVARRDLYLSPYLTEAGRAEYVPALRAAIRGGDEASLADDLRRPGRVQTPGGWHAGAQARGLPSTAPAALAEAEFHRYYVRGLCRRALADGIRTLVIHRAKEALPLRANADGMVGVHIDAASLLEDLRTTSGRRPPRVLHGCPNPGMSVRLPYQGSGTADANGAEADTAGVGRAERRRRDQGTAERRKVDRNTTPRRRNHGR